MIRVGGPSPPPLAAGPTRSRWGDDEITATAVRSGRVRRLRPPATVELTWDRRAAGPRHHHRRLDPRGRADQGGVVGPARTRPLDAVRLAAELAERAIDPARGTRPPAAALAGAVPRRPQRAADDHRRQPRRRLLRGRLALVPDPVRPRLAVDRAAAAAGRPRVRDGHAARPGPAGRHHRSTSTAPRRRARSCTSCGRASRRPRRHRPCPRSTTAPSTPPRCGWHAARRLAGRGAGRRGRGAAAHPGGGAALDRRGRRRRRRRLPGVPRRQRPRPGQPGLEGLRRLGPVRRRHHRRRVRSPCARCRRTRTRRRCTARTCWTPSAGRARERYREWAAALADRFRATFWCGTGRRAASPPWPWTGRSGRWTR